MNLVHAMMLAKKGKAIVSTITNHISGRAKKLANVLILVPTINSIWITPHTESFQAVKWHLLASHPTLAKNKTKW